MEIKPPSPPRSPSSRIPPAIGKAPVGLGWGTLPGRTRPGLIEARLLGSEGHSGHLFRGVRAPASFGMLRLGGGPHRVDLFRGVRAPASLKLSSIRPRLRPSVHHLFRGVRAPASLKRVAIHPMHAKPAFRGVRAPVKARSAHAGSRPLPGRTRPGLIEATEQAGVPAVSHFQCRPLPGRTRPGLIEAISPTAWVRPTRLGLFRGVRAPASLKLRRVMDGVFDLASSSGAYAPRPH